MLFNMILGGIGCSNLCILKINHFWAGSGTFCIKFSGYVWIKTIPIDRG